MQTITSSTLKQNTMLLQNAFRNDLLITKRNKPFVVVMDYEKYQKLEKYINKVANEETYQAITNLENNNNILNYDSKEKMYADLGL